MLDPKIKLIVDALEQIESSGGKVTSGTRITRTEGSKGGLQYTPARFKEDAAKYSGGKFADGSTLDINNTVHQKYLKYKELEALKARGVPMDVAIAAHNMGASAFTKDYRTNKGVNKYGNAYDTGAYVSKVQRAMANLAGAQVEPPQQEPSMASKIGSAIIKAPEQLGRTTLAGLSALGGTAIGNLGEAVGIDSQLGRNTLSDNYNSNLNRLQDNSLTSYLNPNNQSSAQDLRTVQGLKNTAADVVETAADIAPVPKVGLALKGAKILRPAIGGAISGAGMGVANTIREDNATLGSAAKNIGLGAGTGFLAGGTLGVGSRGMQKGLEKTLESKGAQSLASRLGVNPQAMTDMAVNNQISRKTGIPLDVAGQTTDVAREAQRTAIFSKVKQDLYKTLGENATGANPKAIRDKLSNLDNNTLEDLSNIVKDNKIKTSGKKFNADTAIDATIQKQKDVARITDQVAGELTSANVGIKYDSFVKQVKQEIANDPTLTKADLDSILPDVENYFKKSYTQNGKGKVMNFSNMHNVRQDGNISTIDGIAKKDVLQRNASKAVRNILKKNKDVFANKLETDAQREAFNSYLSQLESYGRLKDVEFVLKQLNKTNITKIGGLTRLVAGTIATGGTYNPIAFIGSQALIDKVGGQVVKNTAGKIGQAPLSNVLMGDVTGNVSKKASENIANLTKENTVRKAKEKLVRLAKKNAYKPDNKLPTIKF